MRINHIIHFFYTLADPLRSSFASGVTRRSIKRQALLEYSALPPPTRTYNVTSRESSFDSEYLLDEVQIKFPALISKASRIVTISTKATKSTRIVSRMPETHCMYSRPCRLCHEKRLRSPPQDIRKSIFGNKGLPQPLNLKPIVVPDPDDHVAIRRARNTMAARRARQRKTNTMTKALSQAEKLVSERDHYRNWSRFLFRSNPQVTLPVWVDDEDTPDDQPGPDDPPAFSSSRTTRSSRQIGTASTRLIIPDVLPSASSSNHGNFMNTMDSSNNIGSSHTMGSSNTVGSSHILRSSNSMNSFRAINRPTFMEE